MRDRKSCDIRSLPHLPPPFTPSLDDQPFGLVYWDDQLSGLGESHSLLLYWDDKPSGLGESPHQRQKTWAAKIKLWPRIIPLGI